MAPGEWARKRGDKAASRKRGSWEQGRVTEGVWIKTRNV